MVIVGGGGHGLATAYYLAKEHGVHNVAVLEKGWIGGGSTGRNTTIVRSNYLWDEAAQLYEHSMKLWEGLSQELNFNIMFSRVRMNRQWGGGVDVCPDACPIIGKTPLDGLYFNCGWGPGGFKATPGSGWVFAHTIARDSPHALNAAFSLERFNTGHLIDEHGAAAVAH